MGKLEEEEDEEEEPATEQREEYIDMESNLGEKDEHITSLASALARHVWRQRCKPDDLHHFYEQQQNSYVFTSAFSTSGDYQA